ncbi:MAG TPA: transposase family protein [Alphaproteobacteria bacterium]|nr:transposase family protein [Alphaproteobacteria bacterium]
MPSSEEVTQRAGSLRALTGLTEAEFQGLLPHFEPAFVTYRQDRTLDGHPRTSRRYSTYDTCPLPTIADKLLFILTYLQQNPIQEVQGQLFGMSQSNANKWIHVLHPVLNQALSDQVLLPARTAAEFAAMFETHASDRKSTSPPFWHDGTERPIHRPTDPEEQQEYYSGKKKCHTLNNVLVINETCHVCFLSDTSEGNASEKSLAELAGYTLPPGSCLYQDKGFQGFWLPDVMIVQPKKTPPGGELTPPEKATIRRISSIRIRIEHAIGGVKRYRIVKDKIRLLKDGIRDAVMKTCCGLHNFRLQYRPWHYAL